LPILPNILLRRIYRKGSLRNEDHGVAFELKNIIGPGIITQINLAKINNEVFKPENISLVSNDGVIIANQITTECPLLCKFNQIYTIKLLGPKCIQEGYNTLYIEIISREAGLIQVNFDDKH